MSGVDDKVVSMSFETSKFERGVQTVMSGLDKLKKALQFPNAGKGLGEVDAAANKLNFSKLHEGIDGIKNKFSAMRVVALSVLSNIANQAVSAGAKIIKAFTIGPMVDGFKEYELEINSVQTILGNTAAAGVKLKDVEKALGQLNTYADKTIYNFGEMTKNVGTFTAAGVDLKTSVSSIKGIANMAALSGANSTQAATAMYQLSQAISSGKVALQDWKSVENASMGSSTFKRALAETAVHMGTLEKSAVKLQGPMKNVSINGQNFRNSISAKPGEESWLTSKVLTTTLKHLSGDMTDAQLKAEGYTKAQIKGIQATAKLALQSATQVKTLTQLLGTTKEQIGTGWAETWKIVFGDFTEAKVLFTDISQSIGGFVGASADARNKVLGDWKALGGRKVLIQGLKDGFTALIQVLKPVKDAFREIFPAKTGADLMAMTTRFANFMKSLQIGPATAGKLKESFAGFFAVFSIGKSILGEVFYVIKRLFGVISGGAGGFLDITAGVGGFLKSLDKAIKSGTGFHDFFVKIADVLVKPISLIGKLGEALKKLFGFGKKAPGELGDAFGKLGDKLSPMQRITAGLSRAWDNFTAALGRLKDQLGPIAGAVGDAFGAIGDAIGQAFSGDNINTSLNLMETGLLGGIALMIKKFVSGGFADGLGGGVMKSIAGSFDALTGKLEAMQNNVKADTLKKIATAVALLTASVFALSLIDSDKLNSALSAMAVGFGELLGAMKVLTMISGTTGFLKVPFIAASLILLGTAIDVLTLAVIGLSKLSWGGLLKGLVGVGALLGMISLAVQPLSKGSGGMIRAGLGITAIAIAMKILASAVKDFGSMSWTEIGKGLAAVATALAAIGLASKLFPSGMVSIGVGLIAVAFGLKLLAGAVATFGNMKWGVIGKGILAIAAAMLVIAGAMSLMPPNMAMTAAGLVLVAYALKSIGGTLQSLGGMSVGEIAKGLVAMAGALLLLGLAMYAMSGSLAGAAALAVAAVSLALIAPALERLGNMSWGSILKGLVGLAAALAVLGIAAALMAPISPALLAMGAALLLIGGGLALAGAGIFLIGSGLSMIAVAGPAAISILLNAMIKFIEAIPKMAVGFVMGLLTIVQKIAEVAPQFAAAFVKILTTMIDAIIVLAPKVAEAMIALMEASMKVLRAEAPSMASTGMYLLKALIKGVVGTLSSLNAMTNSIITKIISGIASKLSNIATSGANLLKKFVTGIVSAHNSVMTAGAGIVTKVVSGIVNNVGRVVSAAASLVSRFVSSVSNAGIAIISTGSKMISRLISGISSMIGSLVAKGSSMASNFVKAVGSGLSKLAAEGMKAVRSLVSSISGAISGAVGSLRSAASGVGRAVVQGFLSGLASMDIMGAVTRKFAGAAAAAKRALHIKSPSRLFAEIGNNVVAGFAEGINQNQDALKAMESMSYGVINGVKSIFQITSPSKVMASLGEYVGEGFAEGLMGSGDDIKSAFDTLQDKLNDAMLNIRETISTEEDKLDRLRDAKKKDRKAIKEAQQAVAESKALYDQAKQAHAEMVKNLRDERNQLVGLSKDYQKVSDDLDAAVRSLEDATKARDDAYSGFADKFGDQVDIIQTDETHTDPLGTYIKGLQDRTVAVSQYQSTLQQLRSLGLDDKTYQKLLEDGTADQEFASQLLAGGATAVAGLNALDAQLGAVSKTLAYQASQNLYQAGVDSAQGLVNGLKSQQTGIRKAMEAIAATMIKAIKKKLKIKSPSQEFAEIGKFATLGMAEGLTSSTKVVTDAAEDVAEQALEAMRDSVSKLSSAILTNIDVNPTITPVLDLSLIASDAKTMASMLNVVPITAAASYGQASVISASQNTVQTPLDDAILASGGTQIKFEQNNYSPESLSEAEIYRQTKNQLSQAKGALALA